MITSRSSRFPSGRCSRAAHRRRAPTLQPRLLFHQRHILLFRDVTLARVGKRALDGPETLHASPGQVVREIAASDHAKPIAGRPTLLRVRPIGFAIREGICPQIHVDRRRRSNASVFGGRGKVGRALRCPPPGIGRGTIVLLPS